MSEDILLRESRLSGMELSDLRKRPIWLGETADPRFWTADLTQAANWTAGKAHSRRRRVNRQHVLHYAFRVFSKKGEYFNVPWFRPQHITVQGDSRYPMQGWMQPIDPASWCRHNLARAGVFLTVAPPPPGPLPPKVPHKPAPRPRPPTSGAASSTDAIPGVPGTLSKGQASHLFVMRLSTNGSEPVNPVLKRPWAGVEERETKHRRPSSTSAQDGSAEPSESPPAGGRPTWHSEWPQAPRVDADVAAALAIEDLSEGSDSLWARAARALHVHD